jgi:hypothetical protein
MNEKAIDQIEEEVLSYEVSDEAMEAAGTRTEIAGAWTFYLHRHWVPSGVFTPQ